MKMQDTSLVLNLLERVNGANTSLCLENNQLKLKVKKGHEIPPELLDEIKKHKSKILELLQHREDSSRYQDMVFHQPLIPYDRNGIDRIPVSYSQKRIWFIDQMEGSTHYHIPVLKEVIGDFDTEAFRYSWRSLVDRHEVLRTVFKETEGEIYQHIISLDAWDIKCINAELWSEDEIVSWVSAEVSKPFDLSKDYLVRIHVLKLGVRRTGLVIIYHHIAMDGWSLPIIEQEYQAFYNSYRNGKEPSMLPVSIQYADYAIWQQNYLKGDLLEKKLKWWTDYLHGVSPLNLPTDYARPSVQSTRGASHNFFIDTHLCDGVRKVSKDHGATMFMTLLAGFKVLLSRYSGQSDICVGTPVANRTHKDTENVIGFFVNSLALRSDLSGSPSFTSLLNTLTQNALMGYQLQDVPIESIIERVVKERDLSYRPLFQVMFILHNTPGGEVIKEENEAEVRYHHIGATVAKFDLSFIFTDTPTGIRGTIEYCADLFRVETIERMANHYIQLMSSVTTSPDVSIAKLSMLTLQDKKLLKGVNPASMEYDQSTVIDLFTIQSRTTPDSVAVIFEDRRTTYGELDVQSNQLAHYFRHKGIGRDTRVAVSMERSAELIVALLAILKSGAAYVAVDPDYPLVRRKFILEDSKAAVLLSSGEISGVGDSIQVIALNVIGDDLKKYPGHSLPNKIEHEQPAYVIYTSGSTGQPKGVVINHGSLVDYVIGFKEYFSVSSSDHIIQQSSISFDTMVEEIYPSLGSGASIAIVKEGGKDVARLKQCIEQEGATILSTTPMVLESLSKNLNTVGKLRYVISGGDKLLPSQIAFFFGKVRLVNTYGPSESTVCATYHPIEDVEEASIIGKPIRNREVYILSSDLELLPVGLKGEICISGAGLATGYFGRESLTNEKFVPHPFKVGQRLYRTGDMGKYLPDGRIVFLGRTDDQVKFRGYRIELGEIEHILRSHAEVKDCAVAVWQDKTGPKHLVAYVVVENVFDKKEIQNYLMERLPSFMLPSLYIELDHLPHNANNKVDKRALPDPEQKLMEVSQFISPTNQIQRNLVEIWQELLEVQNVGITDNFFELGGHSLKVMEVVYKIEECFNVKVPIRIMFEMATVEKLSEYIVGELRLEETELSYKYNP